VIRIKCPHRQWAYFQSLWYFVQKDGGALSAFAHEHSVTRPVGSRPRLVDMIDEKDVIAGIHVSQLDSIRKTGPSIGAITLGLALRKCFV